MGAPLAAAAPAGNPASAVGQQIDVPAGFFDGMPEEGRERLTGAVVAANRVLAQMDQQAAEAEAVMEGLANRLRGNLAHARSQVRTAGPARGF